MKIVHIDPITARFADLLTAAGGDWQIIPGRPDGEVVRALDGADVLVGSRLTPPWRARGRRSGSSR